MPTTANSATARSAVITDSLSAGATRLPATFIMSSERPRMNQLPSGRPGRSRRGATVPEDACGRMWVFGAAGAGDDFKLAYF